MVNEIPEIKEKPSFISSTLSGIFGYVKGALAGGIIGAVVGAAATVAVGAILGSGGLGLLILGALGAGTGAAAVGTVGALAGTVTGVVRSREAGQPNAEDIVNVAKISFEQGRNVQHAMEQNAHAHHASKETERRAATAAAGAAPAIPG